MKPDTDNLGALMKECRTHLGISLRAAATTIGCSAGTLSRVERNHYRGAKLNESTLRAACKLYGITITPDGFRLAELPSRWKQKTDR